MNPGISGTATAARYFTCNDGDGGGGGGGGPGGGSGGGTSYSLWVGYYNCPATLWEQGAYVVLHPEVYGFDEGGIEWEYNVVLCFDASGTIVSQWDYLPIQVNDPAADAAAARDSLLAQLAVRVVAPIPEVAASPPVDATHLVGVWTWFWVDPASYQSLSDTASDPAGLTVTLTAIPHDLRFHPGDDDVVGHDTTVSCQGPGLVWQPGLDDTASDCRHLYDYPSSRAGDGTFDVYAESDWEFVWEATGSLAQWLPATTGTLGVTTTASPPAPVTVTEVQAVIGG